MRLVLPAIALCALVLSGLALWRAGGAGGPLRVLPASQGEVMLSFAPVVQAAAPAVVNIYTTRLVGRTTGDPFFDRFFRVSPQVQGGLGSGVIVDGRGLVVTNWHVVDGASDIRVELADGRGFAAAVVRAVPESDLALLALDGAAGLPVLPFADSDAVVVGDLVLAIGNPFGVGQTVSSGIVSALARGGLNVGDGGGTFIQTDAAINPGNSGGALVDLRGRLVGINTAILTRNGGSDGVGFAIPANDVVRLLAR
jgi:S1-C subfamily serine protease